MAIYDLSGFVNATSLQSQYQAADDATGGWISILVLFVVFFVIYMSSKSEDDFKEFVMAFFVTSLAGVLMLVAGLISWHIVAVPLVLFFISLLWYIAN